MNPHHPTNQDGERERFARCELCLAEERETAIQVSGTDPRAGWCPHHGYVGTPDDNQDGEREHGLLAFVSQADSGGPLTEQDVADAIDGIKRRDEEQRKLPVGPCGCRACCVGPRTVDRLKREGGLAVCGSCGRAFHVEPAPTPDDNVEAGERADMARQAFIDAAADYLINRSPTCEWARRAALDALKALDAAYERQADESVSAPPDPAPQARAADELAEIAGTLKLAGDYVVAIADTERCPGENCGVACDEPHMPYCWVKKVDAALDALARYRQGDTE